MTLECPKCKSAVAREGQRFCYRCGQDLNAYYDSLKIKVNTSEVAGSSVTSASGGEAPPQAPPAPKMPVGTVVLEANAFDTQTESPPETPPKASLRILLPTGDVFDRELGTTETQIGKGPRNDIVIADPAVSTTHAMVRLEGGAYLISDISSRNGTFVNGERVAESRQLRHGDVIGIGLSKLTFRLSNHSETGAIEVDTVNAAVKADLPPPLTEESLALAVVTAGLAPKSDVDRVRADSKGRRLYRALIDERLATESGLRDLMSTTFKIPIIDLSAAIDEAVVAGFPGKLAREHQVFPASKEADATVLAVADPTDVEAVERVKREVSSPLTIRLATSSQIREQVDRHYGPKLIGVLPSGEKLEYLIDKNEVEIGKAAHNHITLTDPTVSNTHAIVISRDASYSVVDLGSRNGTFINGERLGSQAHTLRHGDKIQLGQTVLTFRNPAETAANITAVLSGEALEEVRRRAGVPPSAGANRDTGGTPPGAAAPLDASSPAATDAPAETEEEKAARKKKKKKKKGGDERMKAAYIGATSRIVAQVLSVLLAVLLAIYIGSRPSQSPSPPPPADPGSKGAAKGRFLPPGAAATFQGGTFEASGAAFVRGSNGVLIVDDGRMGEVLWMQVDEAGRQVGALKPVPLGVTVEDPEAITSDGNYFYLIGSQSSANGGDQNALVRFTFDAASQSVLKAEAMTNLRDYLLTNIPELNTGRKASEGGLNIEGIAWDYKRACLLLGLRSPFGKDGSALLVALKLRNPAGSFSADNLQLVEPNVIPLNLGGLGVRDIHYDLGSNSFLIISGAPENLAKSEFTLWEWSGSTDQSGSEPALRKELDLDPKLKPEGITYVEVGGRKFVLVVCDASSYLKLAYAESQ